MVEAWDILLGVLTMFSTDLSLAFFTLPFPLSFGYNYNVSVMGLAVTPPSTPEDCRQSRSICTSVVLFFVILIHIIGFDIDEEVGIILVELRRQFPPEAHPGGDAPYYRMSIFRSQEE